MIHLNYTYFGEAMFDAKGIWALSNITIEEVDDGKTKIYNTELLVFVAYGEPPEPGLDGTLGLALSNITEICLLCQLEEKLGFRTLYIQYDFPINQTTGLYTGKVILADGESSQITPEEMTLGGQISLTD